MEGINSPGGSEPTASQICAPIPGTNTNTGAKDLLEREKATRVIITQTLTRLSSTHVATATLHGTLPEVPVPHVSEGISNKKLGAILGATLGSLVVLVLLCTFLACRRPPKYAKPRSHTSSPTRFPPREYPPVPPVFSTSPYKAKVPSGTSRPPSYAPPIPPSSSPQQPRTHPPRQGSDKTHNQTNKDIPDLSSESESEVPRPPPAPDIRASITTRYYRTSITTPYSERMFSRRSRGSRENRRSSGNQNTSK